MVEVPTATAEAREERERELPGRIEGIYEELTDGFGRSLRMAELVYAAAERWPDLVPSRAAIDAERELPQKEKQGLEIDQGIFLAHVLAHPRCGPHLLHAMAQPRPEALGAIDELRDSGSVDLGPARVDRHGKIGLVTTQNHAFLNS
jgi:(3,5-dihydroxyphenyl)acetyl-CoA 1,2-dioxygenase